MAEDERRERKPADPALVVVALVVAVLSTLALGRTGLATWRQLVVQVALMAAVLWAWSRWPRRH